jgi:hypothetical protein
MPSSRRMALAAALISTDPWRAHSFVFAVPCLVDDLEEKSKLGPSLGQEAHRLDAMTHTLGPAR